MVVAASAVKTIKEQEERQKTAEALVGARNLISQLTAQVEAFGGAKPAEVREFTYFVGMW